MSFSANLFDVKAGHKTQTENFVAANLDILASNWLKHALLTII